MSRKWMQIKMTFIKTIIIGIGLALLFASGMLGCIYGLIYNINIRNMTNIAIFPIVGILFLILTVLSISYIILAFSVEISEESIQITNIFGKYDIPWSEITLLHTFSGNMIIGNSEKHLAMPEFMYWNKKFLEKNRELIENKISNLEYKENSIKAMFMFNKNVKKQLSTGPT